MSEVYFKVYLDIFVEVPDDVEDDDEFSYAYDKLEQALKQMDETEGIALEDVEIK